MFLQCVSFFTHYVFPYGSKADFKHVFRWSVSPLAVTSIGWYIAFEKHRLSEVTLREGVIEINRDVFDGCTSLEHINIPPNALVIDIQRCSCQLLSGTMPATPGLKLVVSRWMRYKSPDQLEQAEAKVNVIILSHPQQTTTEKIQAIREWLAYCEWLDVTTLLELAIWRCNMGGNEQRAEARQANRRNCGSKMNVIITGVLEFLEEEDDKDNDAEDDEVDDNDTDYAGTFASDDWSFASSY